MVSFKMFNPSPNPKNSWKKSWFLAYIKDGFKGQIRIFVKSDICGRYGSVVLQQQREDMIQEVSVFYVFFKTH